MVSRFHTYPLYHNVRTICDGVWSCSPAQQGRNRTIVYVSKKYVDLDDLVVGRRINMGVEITNQAKCCYQPRSGNEREHRCPF